MPPKLLTNDFILASLKGGQNDTDPQQAIADDECVLAQNVEFLNSTLGERRLGCENVALTAATNLTSRTHIAFLGAHLPVSTLVENSYLFAVGVIPTTSAGVSYRAGGTWHDVTTTSDPIDPTVPDVYRIQSVSVHGKFFCAYNSSVDRLHVWDGTAWRRTGFAQPAAPTAANSAPAGTFSGARIYRVRYIEKDLSGNILRRSEPSAELTFTPSGLKSGVVVTKPAGISEGETDWELEASSGDGNFYVIATTIVATTTYTDTNNPATAYADFELSEDIGDYENIESVQFIIADQDRLIFGGSWEDATHSSRLSWTPTHSATGVGNDERIPLDVNSFIDLDWQDGGGITGLSSPTNGSFYAFKHNRIYKVQRTGRLSQAYEAFLISTSRGALVNSVVNGLDEGGRPCVYFLDPAVGPCRISSSGLQFMQGIRGTWETVNTTADDVVCHGVYYPDKFQVHWWLATDNSESPNYKIVSQTTELQSEMGATSRGWSVADGTITESWCSCILPEPTTDGVTGITSLTYRPYIGLSIAAAPKIYRCDTGDDDAGDEYQAIIITKPYIMAGLLNKWGARAASLLARPLDDENINLNVSFIRDFGLEENIVTTNFAREDAEELVNKQFDNLRMSNAYAIQIKFADPDIVE